MVKLTYIARAIDAHPLAEGLEVDTQVGPAGPEGHRERIRRSGKRRDGRAAPPSRHQLRSGPRRQSLPPISCAGAAQLRASTRRTARSRGFSRAPPAPPGAGPLAQRPGAPGVPGGSHRDGSGLGAARA